AEAHLLRRLREPKRLEWVGRTVRLARVHVAVAACPGAGVSEDLEGGRATTPALGDVRAARLLADRVQLTAVDQLSHLGVAGGAGWRADLHPLRAARSFGDRQRALHRVESSRSRARARGRRLLAARPRAAPESGRAASAPATGRAHGRTLGRVRRD